MAQVINTNSLSLLTQDSLNESQSSLSSVTERPSSSLRISSAKDDTAGQAIVNRFTANIKGLTQTSRDANDGVSATQTTEGALNEINNNLQRVRELTAQATSGTNSDGDLSSIQAEITQHLEETDRVSEQTQFNGVKVLVGNNEIKIQVGANGGETAAINLAEINMKILGLDGFNIDGAQKTTGSDPVPKFRATDTDNYQISGTDNYTVNVDNGAVQDEDGGAILASATDGSLTTKSDTKISGAGADATGLVKVTVSLVKDAPIRYQGITFTNKGTGALNGSGSDTLTTNIDNKDVAFTIASSTNTTGRDAALAISDPVYKNSTGQLTTTKAENRAATVSDLGLNNARKVGSSLVIDGADYEVSTDGKTVAGPGKTMHLSKSEGGSPILVDEGAVESLQSTTNPLKTIDKALAKVDNLRSDLSAAQNRFDSAITNLDNIVNNLSSARSRIEGADYVTEMSNMSRA